MDEKLKDLVQELGNAINESLSDSDRIAGAIGEIKRAGYEVFLVLEATIGLNKHDEAEDDDASVTADSAAGAADPSPSTTEPLREANGKIRLTMQDQKFLRALKISIEEDHHKSSS